MERAPLFKYMLTRVGALLSSGTIYDLNASINYLEVGRWMHAGGYEVTHRVDCREQLFDLVGNQVAEREVLYMEFGVYQGRATQYWSKLLRNPKSKLHGFDSFEGLPENWLLAGDGNHAWVHPKGYFSTGGKVPEIDDARVQFFKGWFEQTLPNYKFPPHEVLVVVLDADLYSSTSFVLSALENVTVPGTYLYFDEFHHRMDELRAFDTFVKRTGMKFCVVGATRSLTSVMFQRKS